MGSGPTYTHLRTPILSAIQVASWQYESICCENEKEHRDTERATVGDALKINHPTARIQKKREAFLCTRKTLVFLCKEA
jgi:hypothetical protein